MEASRPPHSDPGHEYEICLGQSGSPTHFSVVGEPDNVEGCRGFFTFSVGTKDGRGESESLAEAGGEPEEELWVRGDLRGSQSLPAY